MTWVLVSVQLQGQKQNRAARDPIQAEDAASVVLLDCTQLCFAKLCFTFLVTLQSNNVMPTN